jgi:hypothetical protein
MTVRDMTGQHLLIGLSEFLANQLKLVYNSGSVSVSGQVDCIPLSLHLSMMTMADRDNGETAIIYNIL